jgi:hypothetical protein
MQTSNIQDQASYLYSSICKHTKPGSNLHSRIEILNREKEKERARARARARETSLYPTQQNRNVPNSVYANIQPFSKEKKPKLSKLITYKNAFLAFAHKNDLTKWF